MQVPNADMDASAYLNAWTALGKMLASGRSLSGREKNCCFLNTRGAGFADISATSGFDFPDDARGVAVTDWDGDGDLDVWVTNRNAPRIRFLKNQYQQDGRFLGLRLQGTSSNRDAIGAQVEITPAAESKSSAEPARLTKSLRAGEGYLAQSSKWLHFGLGSADHTVDAIVRWPNGSRETFTGLETSQRHLLVQGQGSAIPQPPRAELHLAMASFDAVASPPEKRIVLPARLPMPHLTYQDLDGGETSAKLTNQPTLINLWATWCTPCLQEISEWTNQQHELSSSNVRVLLLSVDHQTDQGRAVTAADVQQLLRQLRVPFAAGFATDASVEALDITQQVLTKRIREMPVPTSFLVDSQGRLASVYKGTVDFEQLQQDIRNLAEPDQQHRDLAVPFQGRWYTNPFPPDLLAIPSVYRDRDQLEKSLDYLHTHMPNHFSNDPAEPARLSRDEAANMFVELAMLLQERGEDDRVLSALEAASRVQPDNLKTKMALTMVYQQRGNHAKAVEQYREMLSLKPGDMMLTNNLAWTLATARDARARAPDEAIRLAETVCRQSQRQFAPALSTLAAAYAAQGDFDRAQSIIQETITLLRSQGNTAEISRFEDRLKLYRQRKLYLE